MQKTSQSDASLYTHGLRRVARVIQGEARQVWLKFLGAIAGLGLAFAAALFSTVSREAGNFWATLILSSIALLLAVVVGVTTVPMLARRVAGARLRDAFDYDVTRIGIAYVVAVLIVGVAALNTGNNLLYIIVAAMLAAILVSGFASAIVLRGLELDVRLPEHVFAGQTRRGRILLRNSRRWLPSLSISVSASKQKASKKKSTLREHTSEDQTQPQLIFDSSVYFPVIPARREMSAEVELCFNGRGRYQQRGFALATRFPFAFLSKTRHVTLQREIIVYPKIEASDSTLESLPLVSGEYEAFVRGRGYDLYRIREYLPEDSARHVDWKASAKSGGLKVREFSREDERKLRIVFDNPRRSDISAQAYERAVSTAASVAWHFANQHAEVSFATQNYAGTDIYGFLSELAVIAPQNDASVLATLLDAGGYSVVITAQSRGEIPTQLWDSAYFIFIGEGRMSSEQGMAASIHK